jgi:hypothetical protein
LNDASVLKGLGYLTSTLSVILLGAVSLQSAQKNPLLFACLLLGMATSIAGMFLRWRSHRLEQHEKQAKEGKQGTRAASGAGLSTMQ